jgi:DNA-binding transcriptional regulator YdaS (Cro superfamily)
MCDDEKISVKDYLFLRGLSASKFCKEIGVHPAVFSSYINEDRLWSVDSAKKIQKSTKGYFKASELLKLDEEDAA